MPPHSRFSRVAARVVRVARSLPLPLACAGFAAWYTWAHVGAAPAAWIGAVTAGAIVVALAASAATDPVDIS